MGSSVGSQSGLIAAVSFGVLYLAFDAARYFVQKFGAVTLRRWESIPAMQKAGRWFDYDPDQFSLISTALIQTALVCGVGSTIAAFDEIPNLHAAAGSVVIWVGLSVAWKFVLALVPESIAETVLRQMILVSPIFYYAFWPILAPLRWTVAKVEARREIVETEPEVTDEKVQAYIDVGRDEGILEEGEERLVQSIVDFGDAIAREVMTPRVEFVAFAVDGDIAALAHKFSESKYSRIPIYEGNVDHVVGIVHVKDVLDVVLKSEEKSVREIMRPPLFVPETKKISEVLVTLQAERLQLGIVVDEFGGTAGLVTIEDLLEEIVGEMADEHELPRTSSTPQSSNSRTESTASGERRESRILKSSSEYLSRGERSRLSRDSSLRR